MADKPPPIGPLAIILRRTDAGRKQTMLLAAAFGGLLLVGIGLLILVG